MNIHEKPHYSLSRAIFIFIITVLFLLYEMGLQVSPSVMAIDLMRDLKIDAEGLGWIGGAYFYSYSIMQLPAGLLYDRFGARLLVTFASLICIAGAFFFSGTDSLFWACVARFLMGFGSAFAFTGVLVIAATWFHPHHFALLAGMTQFFAGLGALGGALPMAIFVGIFGWRHVMFTLGFIGLGIALLAWLFIRDRPIEKCSPNLVHTPNVLQSVKGVFTKGQNWWCALFAFSAWSPVTLFAALWGAPFLMVRYNVSNELAASSLSAIWIGMALCSPIFGWISDKIHRRVSPLIVSSLIGIAATIILLYWKSLPFWSSYILLFFLGAAGCSQLLTFALIKDRNRPSILATAMGFNNMAVVMGAAIFQPVVGAILTALAGSASQDNVYTLGQYQKALIIMPICYGVCLLLSLFVLKETHAKPLYMARVTED